MSRPFDRLWNSRLLMLAAGDVAIFLVVLAVTVAVQSAAVIGSGIMAAFVPVLGCTLITAYAAGLYETQLMRRSDALVGGICGSAVATLTLGTMYFLVLSPRIGFSPKLTLLLIVAASHAGMLVWRQAVLGRKDFNLLHLRIMVLADESSVAYLRGSFGRRSGDDIKFLAGPPLMSNVNLIVVDRSWSDSHAEQARAVMTAAIGRQIPIISIGEFHESMCGRVSPHDANDLGWALDNVLPRFGGSYFKAKRVVDVVVALPLLVLLAPLIVGVALAVSLMDGGSPFYAQRRVGYLGRSFLLWKFRSMRHGADREGPFIQTAEDGDSRVTRVGALLRRFRIDELPQLWNVVRGDMSLVGPRPEWIKEVEILENALPTYSLRYLVPPGITGWAQVFYRATNSAEAGREKHHYDLYYLKHFSLALDLSIVLKTIKRVVSKERRTFTRIAPAFAARAATTEGRVDVVSLLPRDLRSVK